MRIIAFILLLLCFAAQPASAQTADEMTALIDRLVQLDSIDIARDVKFRPGLAPSLHELDADESKMTVLSDPYVVHGKDQPGAAGWYRVSFVVPEKLGKIPFPQGKSYNCGIESNVLGAWETYTYVNGKPAGLWSQDGLKANRDQHATYWMSNAPMPLKPGDKVTLAILATASPLGRGSPEGFGLRHLRLRFALAHTGARQPFYGDVYRKGQGRGILGIREILANLEGEDLKAFQAKIKTPLANLDAVFKAAETEVLDNLTKAMAEAAKEIEPIVKDWITQQSKRK
ncbi:MAG: hypothetical protein WD768_10880 [Phycisphaeraceae bacterium]